MEALMFWILALVAVVMATMMIFHKNPISSALSLIVVLFCTAGLYVILEATFIAVTQVMVYAGAIMVLFVFVIMLLNLRREELGLRRHKVVKVIGVLFCVGLLSQLIAIVSTALPAAAEIAADFGNMEHVAWLLFTKYMLAFQAVAILLLAAVVGAVVIAKRRI